MHVQVNYIWGEDINIVFIYCLTFFIILSHFFYYLQNRTSRAWQHLDLYGRRKRIPGARVSKYSISTNEERLRSYDFYFTTFHANSTLNHSSVDRRSSRGPTGNIGGEGHYGLNLVGDTNLENCNAR